MRRPAKSQPAIVSPLVDTLCCGGLSLFVVPVVVGYALWGADPSKLSFNLSLFLVTEALINGPHFMASYRLLYRGDNLRKFPIVSLVLPAILIGIILYAFVTSDPSSATDPNLANPAVLQTFGPVLLAALAWHYTGQSWGMTASFAFIAGIRFTQIQRWLIRSGYRALLVFHLLWFGAQGKLFDNPPWNIEGAAELCDVILGYWWAVVMATFVLGLYGFHLVGRESGQRVPVRCWAPWLATHAWYLMLDMAPKSIVLVQLFHALQYLIFPFRVEFNQYAEKRSTKNFRNIRHVLFYYLILVVVGAVVFELPKFASLAGDPMFRLSAIVALAINFHHYCIDGVIWKIRNPEVRHALFGHLEA